MDAGYVKPVLRIYVCTDFLCLSAELFLKMTEPMLLSFSPAKTIIGILTGITLNL